LKPAAKFPRATASAAHAAQGQLGADILQRGFGHRQLAALLPQALDVRRHLKNLDCSSTSRGPSGRSGDERAVHVISPSVSKAATIAAFVD